eukprot:12602551-Ditylum_brightwellii.AAC.1
MRMEWNILAAASCRANRKGFPLNALDIDKDATWGEIVCKVDPCLGMVVTRWKDSKVLQTISTVMEKGTTHVQQWIGWDVHYVVYPNDTFDYQY